jgi:hypothetical protein
MIRRSYEESLLIIYCKAARKARTTDFRASHARIMGTYNAFYVRKQAADDVTRAAILSLDPRARIEISADFVGGVLSNDQPEPPEQQLAELSKQLATDVIWVTSQTTAESFIFHHWRTGEQLRALWYGCANEGTWERVEGEAEPWERDAFWDEESLQCELECAETDRERQKLEIFWRDGLLKKGRTEPGVSSDDAVQAVMDYYGLFDLEETPAKPTSTSPAMTSVEQPRKSFWSRLFGG